MSGLSARSALRAAVSNVVFALQASALVLVSMAVASPAVVSSARAEASGLQKDVAICAAIDNAVTRLECFDALAETLGVATPEIDSTTVSQWEVVTEASPIDDSQNVFLYVSAQEPTYNKFGTAFTPELYIFCRENKTSISVYWGTFLDNEGVPLTIRIDKDPAREVRWSISTDYQHSGLWGGGSSIPFIKSLFGHDELLMRVVPYGENALTSVFPIAGLENAIGPLRKACSW